ncbi:uncharacterized protein LOC111298384 [Durio zibethinus]|uniref:Uncharacterized protein LOC111298384 n=1 Tax=Durio zibethinus TaxID=66656 RepID=A0A6P5Z7V1_DURZI|nr:uncharacterized protein LOC111298384 [Durio zibethinus]
MRRGAAASKEVCLDDDDDSCDVGDFQDVSKGILNRHLESLFEKSASVREESLAAIVTALNHKPQHEFVEENFVTLLYQCLNFTKKGSAQVLLLASTAVGLMAMSTRCADNERQVYKDSIPVLSKLLKTKSNNSQILHCLAMVAFFTADNSEEIEEAMLLIWNFINPASQIDSSKHPPAVLATAISAWSLLLSTLDGRRISHKYWQRAISYFSDQLDNKDKEICVAAGVALALIFETNCLHKFTTHESVISEKQEQKNKIIDKLRRQSYVLSDVVNYFEEGGRPNKHVTIGEHEITLTTWSQMIQLNCMRLFLGEAGFINHMMGNENFHDLFELIPKEKHPPADMSYIPEREEVSVRVFLPGVLRSKPISTARPQLLPTKMTKSCLSKGRTKLLNKQRESSKVVSS